MTFDIELCYIVTPLLRQKEIMDNLIHHWQYGYGSRYNPTRSEALGRLRIKENLMGILQEYKEQQKPLLIGTSSMERKNKTIGYRELNALIKKETQPILLLFGTGWGLSDEVVTLCDRMLAPIRGSDGYNHLSLRVAIGIILDRIFGERGGREA